MSNHTMKSNAGARYEDDGNYTKYGRKDPQGRRLEFRTHDGLGHAVSRVCSRRGAWAEAMSQRAAALAQGRADDARLEAEVDAGMARHAVKSPETPPIWWSSLADTLRNLPAEALLKIEDALIEACDRASDARVKGGAS